MGDARFTPAYERLRHAGDRMAALASLDDTRVLLALGGAAGAGDSYLANVLTTEALNRHRRRAALQFAIAVAGLSFVVIGVAPIVVVDLEWGIPSWIILGSVFALFVLTAVLGGVAYWTARRRLAQLRV